jgi:site-specific DNA-methyltransferase (adenine-specific)
MSEQVSFSLPMRGRNPDVLTCIANLSNDEVFTPPEFANRMLDTLAGAWAANNGGADLWADSSVRFLDPCTKSGVFLREITSRLNKGLAAQIPDLQKRVDHILNRQVFGIAITKITSLLARRSVYCSKHANGEHSIAKSFSNDAGNVWFERIEHTWLDGKCTFCRVGQKTFDRGEGLETHAYAFIHTDDTKTRLIELFGGNMQFDVIIGNPPYQMKGGAGGSSDSSIYHLFVEQALRLDPRFLSMVIPSRWLAGGRGLDEFRKTMLTGKHISHLVDYTKMSTAFPGVDFEGGVGYFLWDKNHQGNCEYTLILGDEEEPAVPRKLDEFDIFVRDVRAVAILKKVQSAGDRSMRDLVSGDTPYGLATNLDDFAHKPFKGALKLQVSVNQKRVIGWIKDPVVTKNRHLIPVWKLFLPKAYGERGAIPANVLGPGIVAGPGSVCTQTYVVAGPFSSEAEAISCNAYLRSRFARFLISLRKITQDLPRAAYSFLPQQTWDRQWTDGELYKKYKLTRDEIAFVERMIRPMADDDE